MYTLCKFYVLLCCPALLMDVSKRNPTKLCKMEGSKCCWCEPNKVAPHSKCKWNEVAGISGPKKHFMLAMAYHRVAFNGNTSLIIATFSSFVCFELLHVLGIGENFSYPHWHHTITSFGNIPSVCSIYLHRYTVFHLITSSLWSVCQSGASSSPSSSPSSSCDPGRLLKFLMAFPQVAAYCSCIITCNPRIMSVCLKNISNAEIVLVVCICQLLNRL